MSIEQTAVYRLLVDHFGNQPKTAAALGVTQATVSKWLSGDWGMSEIVAIRAERKTEGKFTAAQLNTRIRSEEDSAA